LQGQGPIQIWGCIAGNTAGWAKNRYFARMLRLTAVWPALLRLGRRLPPVIRSVGWTALRTLAVPPGLVRWARDRWSYRALPGAEPLRWRDIDPQLFDRLPASPYDSHYFYQDIWAANRIAERRPDRHVDVGSRVDYVGFLTALTRVTFVDIRPLEAEVEGLESVAGSLLDLPFEDRSLESVSCLHVAEHIGLGRYGDSLDPAGTRRAAAELQRVLRPGGQLLFSGPVGRPRVCFNAHRVHSPDQIAAMFGELELVEFSGIDDQGRFKRDRSFAELRDSRYACGLFLYVRPGA
jgi:SAM-dependent methyltransferase